MVFVKCNYKWIKTTPRRYLINKISCRSASRCDIRRMTHFRACSYWKIISFGMGTHNPVPGLFFHNYTSLSVLFLSSLYMRDGFTLIRYFPPNPEWSRIRSAVPSSDPLMRPIPVAAAPGTFLIIQQKQLAVSPKCFIPYSGLCVVFFRRAAAVQALRSCSLFPRPIRRSVLRACLKARNVLNKLSKKRKPAREASRIHQGTDLRAVIILSAWDRSFL